MLKCASALYAGDEEPPPCPTRYPDASTCTRLWDFVRPDLPLGCTTDNGCLSSSTGIRPSIMESFTTHNPSVCITDDDLEAINTLYPVCE